VLAEHDVLGVALQEPGRPAKELTFNSAHGSGAQCAAVYPLGTGIRLEAETLKLADEFAANCDATGVIKREFEIVFVAHHTEASEVTEEDFFHKGESGGTFISSGYQKALDIIAERYHPSLWNIYAFHCSDGDNFDSDNPAALRTAKELAELCNLFGYGEIKPLGSRYYESSMLNVFRRLEVPNFQAVLIERKEDIWPSFKAFLGKDRGAREQA